MPGEALGMTIPQTNFKANFSATPKYDMAMEISGREIPQPAFWLGASRIGN